MKETILRMSIIPDRQRPPGGEENESALIYFRFDLLNAPQLGCSRNEPIFISFFFCFFVFWWWFCCHCITPEMEAGLLPHRRVASHRVASHRIASLDSRGPTPSGTSDGEVPLIVVCRHAVKAKSANAPSFRPPVKKQWRTISGGGFKGRLTNRS